MNWTGGSLHRHSKNAHNSIVNRQKQHFAKIRTALQNGSHAAAVPFRPSYLAEDNGALCDQWTPFGRGSVRHTGHSKRLQKERESEGSRIWEGESRSPRDDVQHLTEVTASRRRHHADTPHRKSGTYVAEPTARNAYDKSKETAHTHVDASDIATEHQLLEANRLRLLNQRDWAGLAAQLPAKIQFPSIREKDRIGKRRKIKTQRGHRAKVDNTITWPSRYTEYETHDKHPGPYTSGRPRNDIDIRDIRIRVGAGALSTETSVQHSDYAADQQAQASREELSDPMLFDHEETHPSPKASRQESRSVSECETALSDSMRRQSSKENQEFSLSEDHRWCETSKRRVFPRGDEVGLHRNQFGEPPATNPNQMLLHLGEHIPATAPPPSEISNSNLLLIGQGGNKPLHLIVDRSPKNVSSMGAVGDTCAMEDGDVEEGVACRQANAGFLDFGHPERSDNGERVFSRRTNGRLPMIVDDRRWKMFVNITETSSSCSTALLSHTPAPQRSSQRNGPDDAPCAWSQQATVGGQTLPQASSPISASLPSIENSNDGGTIGHPSSGGNKRDQVASRRQSHWVDESERLWRTFVFADDEGLVSGGHAMHGCRSESPPTVTTEERAGMLPQGCTDALSMNSMLPPFRNQRLQDHWI